MASGRSRPHGGRVAQDRWRGRMSVLGVVAWYLFLVLVILAYQRLTRCLTTLNIFTHFLLFFVMRHGITVPFDVSVNDRVTNLPLSAATLGRVHLALVIMYVCMISATWFTASTLKTPDV